MTSKVEIKKTANGQTWYYVTNESGKKSRISRAEAEAIMAAEAAAENAANEAEVESVETEEVIAETEQEVATDVIAETEPEVTEEVQTETDANDEMVQEAEELLPETEESQPVAEETGIASTETEQEDYAKTEDGKVKVRLIVTADGCNRAYTFDSDGYQIPLALKKFRKMQAEGLVEIVPDVEEELEHTKIMMIVTADGCNRAYTFDENGLKIPVALKKVRLLEKQGKAEFVSEPTAIAA